MDSWLRAAEELFEVVDRTAKQVVADTIIAPAASEPPPARRVSLPATRDKVGSQKSPVGSILSTPARNSVVARESGRSVLPNDRQPGTLSTGPPQKEQGPLPADDAVNGGSREDQVAPSASAVEEVGRVPSAGSGPSNAPFDKEVSTLQEAENQSQRTKAVSKDHSSVESEERKSDFSERVTDVDQNTETGPSFDVASIPAEHPEQIKASNMEVLPETVKREVQLVNASATVEVPLDRSSSGDLDRTGLETGLPKNSIESISIHDKQVQDESRRDAAPKVEDQLEEARGLLATGLQAGSSRETRLAKVCNGLSARLQEYKAENAQLEELLRTEREAKGSYDDVIRQLQQELASAKAAAVAVESEMAEALALKNAEIEDLRSSFDAMKRQASIAEGKLASLQANSEAVTKTRDMTETRVIQALREELGFAERRAEEERLAHNATRMAAVQRETELEQQMAESTAALMRMQRVVDERTQRAADMEQKVVMLEVDCATLNQELQQMEARFKREQKRPSEDAAQNLNAWREEAERARYAQRGAENKLVAMEAETQKLRVELASTKQDIDRSSSQAQAELEKRFRELTELLYLKQTQLEQLSSEKAAALLQLEKESRRVREAKAEVERSKSIRQAMSFVGDDDDQTMRSFELFGIHQRRLAPSIQRAAKFLDFGAVTAGRFLWRRPLARLAVVFYVFFVHLFLMYLLHRLQVQADRCLALNAEAAAAGISRHYL